MKIVIFDQDRRKAVQKAAAIQRQVGGRIVALPTKPRKSQTNPFNDGPEAA